jgi:L-ascorbate metabolism protein UlaG (beta-lactamase superfamily)
MDEMPRLTFLGHSTVLIELAGLRILTDPVLFDRIGPLRRVVTPLGADLYSRIDLVLVSHLHLDHFDVSSLRLMGPDVRLVVPKGAASLLGRLGFEHVLELGPGEGLVTGSVSVTATAAVHGGFRPPFGPRAAAVGYMIETGTARIYFAGDTDLFAGMADLAPDLDVALLPVWGWGPNLGPGHLDPKRAAQALELLRPRYAIPIHWGTLWPLALGRVRSGRLAHPPREFAALAAETHPEGTVLITPPGQPVSPELRAPAARSARPWIRGDG